MAHVREKLNSEAGVTLVELMVVALVIIIVASIAFMNGGSANPQLQRQNAARQLKEAFERARFDSTKRRADGNALRPFASVEVRANGFTLHTFVDADANPNTAPVARDQEFPIANGITIEHYASGTLSTPMTITFERRGAPTGDPRFRITENSYSTSEVVIVTPTGTVNLVGSVGSNTNFNFSNPSLNGSPGAGDTINNDVIMP
jgi:Tfp pilus assembly protein FimT